MIKNRLVTFINDHQLLPKRSFAFTKNKSSTMLLNQLIHTIQLQKQNGLVVMGVSIDIEKAYDCVDLQVLKEILVSHQFDKRLAGS